MKKIAIIGSGGAGKSELARRLGKALNLNVIHLDQLHWAPGWVPRPKDEMHRVEEELVKGESWIIDGNYGGSQHIRLPAADTIIYLDYSRILCSWRVIKRVIGAMLGRERPDAAPGCPDRFDWEFLKWVWRFNDIQRPQLMENLAKYSQTRNVIILNRPRDARSLVDSLVAKGPAAGG